MSESREHHQLKQVALRWVQNTGCVAFAYEVRFLFGIVDVAGIKRSGDIYIVEAKTTTADMRNDAKRRKLWKMENFRNEVDFIYYIVSDGVDTSLLDTSIGILDETGRNRRNAKRRQRTRTPKTHFDNFYKFAKVCSWRAYGHVIRGEKEQFEFSL